MHPNDHLIPSSDVGRVIGHVESVARNMELDETLGHYYRKFTKLLINPFKWNYLVAHFESDQRMDVA